MSNDTGLLTLNLSTHERIEIGESMQAILDSWFADKAELAAKNAWNAKYSRIEIVKDSAYELVVLTTKRNIDNPTIYRSTLARYENKTLYSLGSAKMPYIQAHFDSKSKQVVYRAVTKDSNNPDGFKPLVNRPISPIHLASAISAAQRIATKGGVNELSDCTNPNYGTKVARATSDKVAKNYDNSAIVELSDEQVAALHLFFNDKAR